MNCGVTVLHKGCDGGGRRKAKETAGVRKDGRKMERKRNARRKGNIEEWRTNDDVMERGRDKSDRQI